MVGTLHINTPEHACIHWWDTPECSTTNHNNDFVHASKEQTLRRIKALTMTPVTPDLG